MWYLCSQYFLLCTSPFPICQLRFAQSPCHCVAPAHTHMVHTYVVHMPFLRANTCLLVAQNLLLAPLTQVHQPQIQQQPFLAVHLVFYEHSHESDTMRLVEVEFRSILGRRTWRLHVFSGRWYVLHRFSNFILPGQATCDGYTVPPLYSGLGCYT